MSDLILPTGLPKLLVAKIKAIAHDIDKCVQTLFRIKNKAGHIVDFHYNQPQRLHSQRSTQFDMVLKARKMGFSSRRIARDIWKCATSKNQHRILLTHTGEGADLMMAERVKPMIDNCKFPLGAVQRGNYYLFPLTGSRYYVGSAGSKKFGRGSDLTGRHFSEYAHWPSPDVVAGIEEASIDRCDGLIETTANGHNFFKKDWERAKRGENQYRAIFLPWYTDDGYVHDASTLGVIGEDERGLVEAFKLTAEQLAWRRWKISTMRDPALFPQEYPETDEQAFLSSGRPVFDWLALARCKNLVSEPKFRGYLVRHAERVQFVPDDKGPLRVWKVPERGHVYAIGSDVAEGLQDGAYSTAEIIDLGDSEQVAEWHGHIAPDLLAEILELLSGWYNQAVVIPESWPGPGEVTTSHLLSSGKVKVWDEINAERPGFHTSERSKTLMIASLASAVRDFSLTIRSPDLLEELHSFVYDERGHMGPSLGNFSDRVMGMGIAWYTTRDMASRVDYYKSRIPMGLGQQTFQGPGTTSPKWQGQRPGVRRPD